MFSDVRSLTAWSKVLVILSKWFLPSFGAVVAGSAIGQVMTPPPAPAPSASGLQSPAPAPSGRVMADVHAAPAASPGFETYKAYLSQLARRAGVREATILASIPALRLNERAVQFDRAQRPPPSTGFGPLRPLSPYLQEQVTPSLIRRGQARYYSHWPHLVRIHARYGVDPAVVMAIYGKETSYGSVTGSFDLLEVLASLAYEGRRREMFETEFIAALKLLDSGVGRERLRGSYAGATGYPQFMPSVVLRLRADGDGDGYADIWSNEVDALASIANYLRDAGWRRGIAWGAPAQVPATLNRAAIRSTEVPERCAAVFRRHSRWMTIAEWRALGVIPFGRALPYSETATLMEPDGPGGPAYLLTSNYRAILGYNCSNYYAMSVGLLSDAIARR